MSGEISEIIQKEQAEIPAPTSEKILDGRNVAPIGSAEHPSDSSGKITLEEQRNPLRTGKWTKEEEAFTKKVIVEFNNGSLDDCPDGCSLRSYLSQKLNCNPMRISKKLAGLKMGKNLFHKASGLINPMGNVQDVPGQGKLLDGKLKSEILKGTTFFKGGDGGGTSKRPKVEAKTQGDPTDFSLLNLLSQTSIDLLRGLDPQFDVTCKRMRLDSSTDTIGNNRTLLSSLTPNFTAANFQTHYDPNLAGKLPPPAASGKAPGSYNPHPPGYPFSHRNFPPNYDAGYYSNYTVGDYAQAYSGMSRSGSDGYLSGFQGYIAQGCGGTSGGSYPPFYALGQANERGAADFMTHRYSDRMPNDSWNGFGTAEPCQSLSCDPNARTDKYMNTFKSDEYTTKHFHEHAAFLNNIKEVCEDDRSGTGNIEDDGNKSNSKNNSPGGDDSNSASDIDPRYDYNIAHDCIIQKIASNFPDNQQISNNFKAHIMNKIRAESTSNQLATTHSIINEIDENDEEVQEAMVSLRALREGCSSYGNRTLPEHDASGFQATVVVE